jgi:hypothetical protein
MKLLLGLLFLSHTILMASDDDDYVYKKPDPIQLPRSLKKMRLPTPVYDARILEVDETHPVLKYDLSPASIAAMKTQYEVAEKAENAGHNELALRIYWSLAEQGYGEANYRLACAFDDGNLGLSRDQRLFSFFLDRPSTVKEMISKQNNIRSVIEYARAQEAVLRLPEEKDQLEALEELGRLVMSGQRNWREGWKERWDAKWEERCAAAKRTSSPPGDGGVVEVCLDDKEEAKLLSNGSRHDLRHRAGKK